MENKKTDVNFQSVFYNALIDMMICMTDPNQLDSMISSYNPRMLDLSNEQQDRLSKEIKKHHVRLAIKTGRHGQYTWRPLDKDAEPPSEITQSLHKETKSSKSLKRLQELTDLCLCAFLSNRINHRCLNLLLSSINTKLKEFPDDPKQDPDI